MGGVVDDEEERTVEDEGVPAAIPLASSITTAVAAAASVPASSTAMNAWCSTSLT